MVRAAARAMLQRKTALTPYDRDCLILHSCCTHFCGHAKPDSQWLEGTPSYKRGREVSDAVYGPIIPCHLDPEYPHRTMASIFFEGIHSRVPHPGKVLRYDEVAEMYSATETKAEVERIQRAWARRLAYIPCPFRYEEGKMLVHQDDGSWREEKSAAYWWSHIEDDVFDRDPCPYPPRAIPDEPSIRAMVFGESKDGKRLTKPFDSNSDSLGPNSTEVSA